MRVFNTLKDATKYAKIVLNANRLELQEIRKQLKNKGIIKFNGLVLLYDELHLLD